METNEKNLQKLEKLLSLMDSDTLTKEDFAKAFENVVKTVKKLEERNMAEFEMIKNTFKKFSDKIANDNSMTTSEMKSEIERTVESYMNKMSERHAKIESDINNKILEVKDGKDADEEEIVGKILEKIKIPTIDEIKNDLPIMGEQVRDALELLQDDERLDVSAIKGLKELLKEKTKVVGGGGGFSLMAMQQHFFDDELPSGTINGINTDFTIARTPNPASSLKVFMNGQRLKLTTDYTFANKTITFLTAPETGDILTVDYRA